MATNLVTEIMQYLTPDMIGRIAAALGLNQSNASTAVSASVPALLAGLCGVAAQPSGASKLLDSAGQQTGMLDKFAGMLGGDKAGLIDKGSQILSSLFGRQEQSALAGAVAKFSGLNAGAGSSLLGMLAPVVMGTIARQPAARGGDAGALANLLASQKDNIAAALPSGFSKLLGATGLLGTFGGITGAATAAADQAARAAGSAANAVAATGQRAAGAAASTIPSWLYAALAAIVAALVIWFLVGRMDQAPTPVATGTQSLIVDGVKIDQQLNDTLGGLRTTLQSVTDASSAKLAIPKLQDAAAQLDKVGGLVDRLSPDQRKVAAGLVAALMPTLNVAFDKLLAIPEISTLLKPSIDTLKASLAKIAG